MNPFQRLTWIAVAVALTVGFFNGCEERDEPSTADNQAQQQQEPAPGNPSPESGGLSLDGSEKWQTDEHTQNHVARMTALIETTPPDELGGALASEIQQLFAGCTMKGPAHDQLHIFLADLLAEVNALYSSETPEERTPQVEAIRRLFENYGRFFE